MLTKMNQFSRYSLHNGRRRNQKVSICIHRWQCWRWSDHLSMSLCMIDRRTLLSARIGRFVTVKCSAPRWQLTPHNLYDLQANDAVCSGSLSSFCPGPNHGPSGPWGMKATAGPSYNIYNIDLILVLFLLLSSLLEMLFMLKNNYIFAPKQLKLERFMHGTWS